jgi:hypothetical protein
MLGGLTLFGLLLALRKAPRELAPLLAAVAASVATVLITHPLHGEIGAIFVRYALPIFLLIPLGVAVAGQWIAGLPRTPAMRWFAGSAGLLGLTSALYFTGPLPAVYVGDASFTKHPAFQYDYADFDGTQSLPDPIQEAFAPLRRAQLHPFYAMLRLGSPGAPIIEYPFLLGQGMNRLYFAQMLHQRPVLAGYYASGAGWSDRFGLSLDDTSATRPRPQGFLMGEMTIDHALGHASPDAKKRFRTVIDVSDVKAIKASGAAYVVLHWNLPREFLFLEVSGERGAARGRFVATIRDRLQGELGSPIVDDFALTVFKVR